MTSKPHFPVQSSHAQFLTTHLHLPPGFWPEQGHPHSPTSPLLFPGSWQEMQGQQAMLHSLSWPATPYTEPVPEPMDLDDDFSSLSEGDDPMEVEYPEELDSSSMEMEWEWSSTDSDGSIYGSPPPAVQLIGWPPQVQPQAQVVFGTSEDHAGVLELPSSIASEEEMTFSDGEEGQEVGGTWSTVEQPVDQVASQSGWPALPEAQEQGVVATQSGWPTVEPAVEAVNESGWPTVEPAVEAINESGWPTVEEPREVVNESGWEAWPQDEGTEILNENGWSNWD